ncbi:hypothetical protein D3C86_2101840 [compost metagenome]
MPDPCEAKLYCPGDALRYFTSSGTVFTGSVDGTTRMCGTLPMPAIGTKSLARLAGWLL